MPDRTDTGMEDDALLAEATDSPMAPGIPGLRTQNNVDHNDIGTVADSVGTVNQAREQTNIEKQFIFYVAPHPNVRTGTVPPPAQATASVADKAPSHDRVGENQDMSTLDPASGVQPGLTQSIEWVALARWGVVGLLLLTIIPYIDLAMGDTDGRNWYRLWFFLIISLIAQVLAGFGIVLKAKQDRLHGIWWFGVAVMAFEIAAFAAFCFLVRSMRLSDLAAASIVLRLMLATCWTVDRSFAFLFQRQIRTTAQNVGRKPTAT